MLMLLKQETQCRCLCGWMLHNHSLIVVLQKLLIPSSPPNGLPHGIPTWFPYPMKCACWLSLSHHPNLVAFFILFFLKEHKILECTKMLYISATDD